MQFRPPPGLEGYGKGQSLTPLGPAQQEVALEGALPNLLRQRQLQEKETERKGAVFAELLQTKEGADRLCEQLEAAGSERLPVLWGALVDAVLPRLPQLACDPHASQVVTRLIAHPLLFEGEIRTRIIHRLRGSLFNLVRDKHGCWIVQQSLQTGGAEFVEALISDLRGRVLNCCRHMYGNFVLQRCFELLPPAAAGSLLVELTGCAVAASLNLYSGRVLQRILEHCDHEQQHVAQIVESLLEPAALSRLVTSAHGHNVVRSLLVTAKPSSVQSLVSFFLMPDCDLFSYARNRHASLVLESCLEAVNRPDLAEILRPERTALLQRLLSGEDPLFAKVALDRFGNYVCQRVILISQGAEAEQVLGLIATMSGKLRRTTNGRHILATVRARFGQIPQART